MDQSDGSCCSVSCRLTSRAPVRGTACFLEMCEWAKATEGYVSVRAAFLPIAREVALEVELDPDVREMVSFSGFP